MFFLYCFMFVKGAQKRHANENMKEKKVGKM